MKTALAVLFLFTFSHTASANAFDDYLDGSTWCFQDRAGPWDHARFQFHYVQFPWFSNWLFYDVTDAPGRGGRRMEHSGR